MVCIKLEGTVWNCEVEAAIKAAKEYNLPVIFERDGCGSTDDLAIVARFITEGFEADIQTHNGVYTENAIRVVLTQ